MGSVLLRISWLSVGLTILILLASPDAARSEWVESRGQLSVGGVAVGNEGVRRQAGLVPEHTDGAGDFDWTKTDALPPCLRGVFAEEPRYVDLRWIDKGKLVAGRDPRFRECIADLAAPLHGLSKVDLIGEDVRQHHRTILLARLAVTSLAATAGEDQTIRLWNPQTLGQVRELKESGIPYRLVFSPDGKMLASANGSPAVTLWSVETTDAPVRLGPHASGVASVAFSPDGKTLAAGTFGRAVLLWDVQTQQRLNELGGDTGPVWNLAFSPDGKTLASDSGRTVLLWDVVQHKRSAELSGHTARVTSLAFSPRGQRLASGSEDTTVLLWDVKTQTFEADPRQGQGPPVRSVAFSPDGRFRALAAARNVVFRDVTSRGRPPRYLKRWRRRR